MSCCFSCATSGASCGGETIGDFSMPRVYTQLTDIDALKQRLDPDFRATDASVQGCEALTTGERKAWDDFYAAWRKYADTSSRAQVFCFDAFGLQCIGGGTVYEDGLEREKRLREWQQKIHTRCVLDAPDIDDPRKRTEVDTAWVKWAAGAVAVVGLAYTLGPVLRGLGKR
jgi:hypothetical protein